MIISAVMCQDASVIFLRSDPIKLHTASLEYKFNQRKSLHVGILKGEPCCFILLCEYRRTVPCALSPVYTVLLVYCLCIYVCSSQCCQLCQSSGGVFLLCFWKCSLYVSTQYYTIPAASTNSCLLRLITATQWLSKIISSTYSRDTVRSFIGSDCKKITLTSQQSTALIIMSIIRQDLLFFFAKLPLFTLLLQMVKDLVICQIIRSFQICHMMYASFFYNPIRAPYSLQTEPHLLASKKLTAALFDFRHQCIYTIYIVVPTYTELERPSWLLS